MKMKHLLFAFMGGLLFTSCIEHEVIPPPKVKVDLDCSFTATLEGSDYNLVAGVGGFYCDATRAKEILPNPQPSTAKYYAAIRSDEQFDFIQVKMGSVLFDAEVGPDPTLEEFTQFFEETTNPEFKTDANEGVEIVYRNNAGSVYFSKEADPSLQTFSLVSVSQESDEDGDYLKFTANFSCNLYDDPANPTDTVTIENGVYIGYFQL
jgi:hypothetical protein